MLGAPLDSSSSPDLDRYAGHGPSGNASSRATAEKIPVGRRDAGAQFGARRPAQLREAAHVEQLLRRTVGSAGVEHDAARISDHVGYQSREIRDREVAAGADIEKLVGGVVLQDE